MSDYRISTYSIIRKGHINSSTYSTEFQSYNSDDDFFKDIYKNLNIQYPKFYKIDRLCKLAFLTAEFLFAGNENLNNYDPRDILMVFSNSGSSIDADIKHNQTIMISDSYFPKPAIFVYTLPNIMLGELSIRHNIQGEGTFFISKKIEIDFVVDYIINTLDTTKYKACILGRVEYSEKEFESAMFFIEKSSDNSTDIHYNRENLERKFYNFV